MERQHPVPPESLLPFRHDTFALLLRKIDVGELDKRQTDWGAWVARTTKKELREFIAERYDGDPQYHKPDAMPHLYSALQDVRHYVEGLEDGRRYAIVASEL